MVDQPSFFDVDERYAALSASGDPLERLSAVVDLRSSTTPALRSTAKANATRARIRSDIEHVFAAQKDRMALFVRTIGLAQVKIGMANLNYNFARLAGLSARTAPI